MMGNEINRKQWVFIAMDMKIIDKKQFVPSILNLRNKIQASEIADFCVVFLYENSINSVTIGMR